MNQEAKQGNARNETQEQKNKEKKKRNKPK